MAAFPPQLPIGGNAGTPQPAAGPPPQVPGVTQPQTPPPNALMQALFRRPEQASTLVRQAIAMLEQAAGMDSRIETRVGAAVKLLRGPAAASNEP